MVNVGILGYNLESKEKLIYLLANYYKEIDLVCIADPNATYKDIQEINATCKCLYCEEYKTIINHIKIEVVMIFSDYYERSGHVISCLEKNKDVYVCGPVCLEREELSIICSLAIENSCLFFVGFKYIYDKRIRAMRKAIDEEIYGKIKYINILKINKNTKVFRELIFNEINLINYLIDGKKKELDSTSIKINSLNDPKDKNNIHLIYNINEINSTINKITTDDEKYCKVECFMQEKKIDNLEYDDNNIIRIRDIEKRSNEREIRHFWRMIDKDRMTREENSRYIEKQYCMLELTNYVIDIIESAEY